MMFIPSGLSKVYTKMQCVIILYDSKTHDGEAEWDSARIPTFHLSVKTGGASRSGKRDDIQIKFN